MVIVLIRTVLREDADTAAYERTAARMDEIVRGIPGFLSAVDYRAADGDEISLVRFASADALRAWREHPEHVEAQRRGQTEFYASYDIEVCELTRSRSFRR